jgi:hypothetical protein
MGIGKHVASRSKLRIEPLLTGAAFKEFLMAPCRGLASPSALRPLPLRLEVSFESTAVVERDLDLVKLLVRIPSRIPSDQPQLNIRDTALAVSHECGGACSYP